MFDKLVDIKDMAVDRLKNLGLVRVIELGSGVAILMGAVLINFLTGDELMATDIVNNYEDVIEVEDAVVEDATDDDSE